MKNDCDNQYILKSSNTFDEKCFDRRPLQNIATQIKSDVYFLIINPLSINIICNGSVQTIRMFKSSKILNNTCLINSTFYSFDKNSTRDYGIYFANATTHSNQKYEIDTLIQFMCFVGFLFLYIIFMNFILFYYYKSSALNNSLNNLENPV